jgi:hypothetical protein
VFLLWKVIGKLCQGDAHGQSKLPPLSEVVVYPAFHKNQTPFAKIFVESLSQASPGGDVKPYSFLHLFAVTVGIVAIGSQGKVSD